MKQEIENIIKKNLPEIQGLNQCILEIKKIDNQRMIEASKNNRVYDASITSWCQVMENILFNFTIADEVLKVVVENEIKYWKNIFDNPPKRDKPYPCDNCTQNICRLEIEKWERLLTNSSTLESERLANTLSPNKENE